MRSVLIHKDVSLRIHCSDEYVRDRATVFHSAYLDTCRLRWSTKSVPLGHYLLPPLSVQKEVKAVIGRFIWEQEELLGNVTQQETRRTEQVSTIQPGGRSPRTEEPIRQNIMMTSPPRDPSACCEVQLYPVNNMISGFVHIDQLKKFTGELHDFLPSHSGSSIRCSYKRLSKQ
ncbi:telomere repeats-binding bouquet formation protein 2 isoform X2 [Trichomycterus rosablanca]|uniref:telomere repeats-binding bouquet formation protein 2 isoform X2 n=1 Tax=Trichomycterus rosablanca TaxID=2290929 RepID=UPI002F3570EF